MKKFSTHLAFKNRELNHIFNKNDNDKIILNEGMYIFEIEKELLKDLDIYLAKSKIGLLIDWYWRLDEHEKKGVTMRKINFLIT